MKYIIICILTLIICFGLAFIPTIWICKKKKLNKISMLLIFLCSSIVIMSVPTLGYLSIYYHADQTVEVNSSTVTTNKINGGYFFDGPGKNDALIFYPGAKVDTLAYAPLMNQLAKKGVDCFLADMPLRMAFFNSNIADKFINNYSYNNWSISGHSLGGLVASSYASKHADKINNLILLASYPSSDIPNTIKLCSIYGTKDGCLNLKSYKEAKSHWPTLSCEHKIEGANHAQYGNYGVQSGDLDATITREKQQELVVDYILEMIENK